MFGSQGFWQHQVFRGAGGWGSRKYSALEGCGSQCWPTRSSVFAWRATLTFYSVAELDIIGVTLRA